MNRKFLSALIENIYGYRFGQSTVAGRYGDFTPFLSPARFESLSKEEERMMGNAFNCDFKAARYVSDNNHDLIKKYQPSQKLSFQEISRRFGIEARQPSSSSPPHESMVFDFIVRPFRNVSKPYPLVKR